MSFTVRVSDIKAEASAIKTLRRKSTREFNIALTLAVRGGRGKAGVKQDLAKLSNKTSGLSLVKARKAITVKASNYLKLQGRILMFVESRPAPNVMETRGARGLKSGVSYLNKGRRVKNKKAFLIPGTDGKKKAYIRIRPGNDRKAIRPLTSQSVGSLAKSDKGNALIVSSFNRRAAAYANERLALVERQVFGNKAS